MSHASAESSTAAQSASLLDSATAALVLEQMGRGVVLLDRHLNVCYRNRAAREWLGAATSARDLFSNCHPMDPTEAPVARLADVVRSGEPCRFECALGQGDRRSTTVLSFAGQLLRESPSPQEAVVVLIVEDASRFAGLEQRLAVSERLAAIGKLASRVAHELNNPLDGILRYVNLSLRVAGESSEGKLRSYLTESRTGLLRMVQIIGELLEFSRTTHGQFDLTGINDLVEQAIKELAPQADRNSVIITADYHGADMPAVHGVRLFQVCCNLIKNAIDAMPEGGRLTITTGVVDEQVVIRVADTGMGLPAEADRVFEPFFTTKEAGKGTGLGLAICKDFVEGMDGVIGAAAVPGGGAEFTIRIPVASCQPPPRLTQSIESSVFDPSAGGDDPSQKKGTDHVEQ